MMNSFMEKDSEKITNQGEQNIQAPPVPSAQEISALDLNNVRLDITHTILTPEYLEEKKNKDEGPQGSETEAPSGQISV